MQELSLSFLDIDINLDTQDLSLSTKIIDLPRKSDTYRSIQEQIDTENLNVTFDYDTVCDLEVLIPEESSQNHGIQ